MADVDLTPAEEAREHLATIRRGWRHVLDPIETTSVSSGTRTERPATEDEADAYIPPDARFDTPRTLAFWVHAALDEWPTINQTLEPGPDGKFVLKATKSVDLGDVYAMVDFLSREAERIAGWVDGGHDFGLTFVEEMGTLARAVRKVAWPPKGDRMTIGECPACLRRVRVKAPSWHRVPHPTTDPATYPAWSEWQPQRDRLIACRCGVEDTLEGWHGRIVDFEDREPKTAAELIEVIAAAGYARYKSPAIVRQWQRQGLVAKVATSPKGESMYDPVQVLAALTDRETRREREVS